MYHQVFCLHAKLLKIMAHPHRLEIIHLLRDQEVCVNDIQMMLDLPQATVSQHLMVLRDAGVVVRRKMGKLIYYKIKYPQIIQACDLIREILVDQNQDQQLSPQLIKPLNEIFPIDIDPVCGMQILPNKANFSLQLNNHIYYFCAGGCLKLFKSHPEKYVRI